MKGTLLAFVSATIVAVAPAQAKGSKYDGIFTEKEMKVVERNSEYFVKRMEGRFKGMAPEGVLTKEMLVVHDSVMRARQRGGFVGRMMMFDLDGDFLISGKELDIVSKIAPKEAFGKQRSEMMGIDKEFGNGDGNVSIQEANRKALKETALKKGQNLDRANMLRFDVNKDGKVTTEEIAKIGDALKKAYPPKKKAQLPKRKPGK